MFAANNSLYIECIVEFSEPVLYCTKCVASYKNAMASFEDLLHAIDLQNKTCASRFMNVDKLNLVEAVYERSVGYWNMGSCSGNFNVFQTYFYHIFDR